MMKQTKKYSRIVWLDLARAIAILCVVLCHCTENVYSMNIQGMTDTGFSKFFAFLMFSTGRLGVPVFLFLTGYLLLGRTYQNTEDVIHFWKRKLLPLIVTFECWTILNELFFVFIQKNPFYPGDLLKNMLLLDNINFSHMWYMPMIIGMYLLLPFVGMIMQHFPVKILLLPMAACFFYYFLVPTANPTLQVIHFDQIFNKCGLEFTGGCYGLYIIIGYITRRIKEHFSSVSAHSRTGHLLTISKILSLPACVIFLLTTAFYQIWCYSNGVQYNVWYNCAFLFLSSVFLFCAIGYLDNHRIIFPKIWTHISEASLGIFFSHKLVLIILKENIVFSPNKMLHTMELYILCFFISYVLAEIGGHIPVVSRVLFLRKTPAYFKSNFHF